jgi:hypothetical protein
VRQAERAAHRPPQRLPGQRVGAAAGEIGAGRARGFGRAQEPAEVARVLDAGGDHDQRNSAEQARLVEPRTLSDREQARGGVQLGERRQQAFVQEPHRHAAPRQLAEQLSIGGRPCEARRGRGLDQPHLRRERLGDELATLQQRQSTGSAMALFLEGSQALREGIAAAADRLVVGQRRDTIIRS